MNVTICERNIEARTCHLQERLFFGSEEVFGEREAC